MSLVYNKNKQMSNVVSISRNGPCNSGNKLLIRSKQQLEGGSDIRWKTVNMRFHNTKREVYIAWQCIWSFHPTLFINRCAWPWLWVCWLAACPTRQWDRRWPDHPTPEQTAWGQEEDKWHYIIIVIIVSLFVFFINICQLKLISKQFLSLLVK